MRRAVPQGGIPADWFFHSDDQFSVSAVTNAAGALAERVAYGDFGAPTFFTPGGSAMAASAIGNPYAFTGRRWDAAERTYHYRFRTFSPGLGRFTTRDPIGIWGDALNLGNGYTYTGNDPWSWVDPWGEDSCSIVCFPEKDKTALVVALDDAEKRASRNKSLNEPHSVQRVLSLEDFDSIMDEYRAKDQKLDYLGIYAHGGQRFFEIGPSGSHEMVYVPGYDWEGIFSDYAVLQLFSCDFASPNYGMRRATDAEVSQGSAGLQKINGRWYIWRDEIAESLQKFADENNVLVIASAEPVRYHAPLFRKYIEYGRGGGGLRAFVPRGKTHSSEARPQCERQACGD
ncbi:MAG: hypothetical protein PWP23_2777, partial [Candidatus Sumerlaeota bacterium]|nr:hypothetical protein [Candidatus Sumerlaeota bacterium]